jgi:hypothetical protein
VVVNRVPAAARQQQHSRLNIKHTRSKGVPTSLMHTPNREPYDPCCRAFY